jgi:hypothetical protein
VALFNLDTEKMATSLMLMGACLLVGLMFAWFAYFGAFCARPSLTNADAVARRGCDLHTSTSDASAAFRAILNT